MFFNHVKQAPVDPIFGLKKYYTQDTRENKVFLSVGIFQSEELVAEMFGSIKKAVEEVGRSETVASYLPIDGDKLFVSEVSKLIFGKDFHHKNSSRIYGAQTVGGTSALRICGENILQHLDNKIFLTNPTWSNHNAIFDKVGLEVYMIPYYDYEKNCIDFDHFKLALEALPKNSALVLHACCHNPTGTDLTKEQWKEVSALLKDKEILPIFDFAYQGFGNGLEEDSYVVRLFANEGHEMFITYSCSKNFSLYRQRTGILFFIGASSEQAQKVASHIKKTIRVNYSNPPSFGKNVVTKVLTDPVLKNRWLLDLQKVRNRLANTRENFSSLLSANTGKDFSFINRQKGMFSLLGLSKKQVDKLRDDYAIYMPSDGRINMAGLANSNMDYIAASIAKVL